MCWAIVPILSVIIASAEREICDEKQKRPVETEGDSFPGPNPPTIANASKETKRLLNRKTADGNGRKAFRGFPER